MSRKKNFPESHIINPLLTKLVQSRWLDIHGSRLTFQLSSPVASDRFDLVAKTNFSLARHLNIHCRIKSSIKCSMALDSQKIAVKTSELVSPKNILFFQITDS